MKIIDVNVVYLKLPEVEARANGTQDALLVKVTTDAGISGVGEVDSLPLAAKAIIEAPLSNSIASGLRELIVGEDPFAYEKIWQKMYLGSRYPGRRGAVVEAIREAVGPKVDVLIDAGHAYDTKTAIQMARRFAQYDIYWFEEPLFPDNLDGYAKLAGSTHLRIAAGEAESNRHSFYDLMDR